MFKEHNINSIKHYKITFGIRSLNNIRVIKIIITFSKHLFDSTMKTTSETRSLDFSRNSPKSSEDLDGATDCYKTKSNEYIYEVYNRERVK